MAELSQPLYFKDGREWRSWLEKNHTSATEAWLLYYKKNSGKTSISYNETLEEALCFGWIDGKLKSIDEEKFTIRYSPRKARSLWSLNNRETAERLIKEGRMTVAGLEKIEEARRNGLWEKAYSSRRDDTLPVDLREALMKDAAAWENFTNFARGQRNSYIYWVELARTVETRRRRINTVVERSRQNLKPGM